MADLAAAAKAAAPMPWTPLSAAEDYEALLSDLILDDVMTKSQWLRYQAWLDAGNRAEFAFYKVRFICSMITSRKRALKTLAQFSPSPAW